ncbi:hypothetical protein ACH5RR_032240 [Cinchona calisaya]|uniref:Uncharacterized protein n=1 Tax=Cinchona calisaya TaxID=153742 RepID=A0ABD2YIM1_9GENT
MLDCLAKFCSSILVLELTDVRAFKMDQDGIAEVSGFADPDVLLKTVEKQGKKAELCWFQYGKCSSNLFGPSGKDVKGVPRAQAKSSSDKSASAVNAQAPPTGNVTTTTAKN